MINQSWDCYADTILELRAPQGLMLIDLRQPLSANQRQLLGALGPAPRFAVITAYNPVGLAPSAAENARRDEDLGQVLAARNVAHMRADGVSPDRGHREPGYAVWTERESAARLAASFEQSAIFWFDGVCFWIVGAMIDAPAIQLPAVRHSEG